MPRKYKSKPGARPYNSVPASIVAQAIDDYKNGRLSQREACKKYGIARSSFQNHLKVDRGEKVARLPGAQTILSPEFENSLVLHLIHLSDWGFPFDIMDLRMNVKQILDKEGRVVKCFKDNVPGEDWCSSFMERHKDRIKNRLCQNISRKRAEVSKESIEQFFTELEQSIDGVPPQNIINYDETNLTDDPGRKKLIFKRGVRYPERIMNSTKTSTSLMLAGSAAGQILPVYVVYKSEHLWSTWIEGGPDKARFNRSKSGWLDHICFVDWFRSIALPHCKNLEGKKILIGDNLSSHFSNEVLRLCEQHNISFVCFPPNATHLLQPLDVAYFRPMKSKWRSILTDYKVSKKKNAGTIPKDVFPKLLKKLMMELPNQEENIKAGFRKCGLHPLDKTPILKRLPQASNESLSNSVSEVFTEHLRQLRHGDNEAPPRKMRRKRLDVVPGRSIGISSNEEPSGSAAEATQSRAEPEIEEAPVPVPNPTDGEVSLSDALSEVDEEVDLSSEDEWTPATGTRNIFESFN